MLKIHVEKLHGGGRFYERIQEASYDGGLPIQDKSTSDRSIRHVVDCDNFAKWIASLDKFGRADQMRIVFAFDS